MQPLKSRALAASAAVALVVAVVTWNSTRGSAQVSTPPPGAQGPIFHPSAQCAACHNGLTTPAGEDVSLGTAWRPSMMAHSARDPYWLAGVRREVLDHPAAQAEIENECSRCHMPMAHVATQAGQRRLSIFANVPQAPAADPLAVEGVSCALCHQIAKEGLGLKTSFNGGFVVDSSMPFERRAIFGPFAIDKGRSEIMRSATGFLPTTAAHIQESEVCATCHTLYTHALDASGKAHGEFPEQMPYREWLHSDYRQTQSCQACHMPVIDRPTPIASVLGEPREGLSRHDFRGGNFFMLGVLNRFRQDLGVTAPQAELQNAVLRTRAFLKENAATIAITRTERVGNRLEADVLVRNLGGHKLPTGYPSRRSWLHVTVMDRRGRVLFNSGELRASGAISGNDNDGSAATFEPHHEEIRLQDQVQVYEAIMGTQAGTVTTGLLSAVTYLKDNRLLPRGFDKRTAPKDVAVHGEALEDADFAAGEDRVRYSIEVSGDGPFTIEAQLLYQPVAFRWAQNLRSYDAIEPRRFAAYYDAMSSSTAVMLAVVRSTTDR